MTAAGGKQGKASTTEVQRLRKRLKERDDEIARLQEQLNRQNAHTPSYIADIFAPVRRLFKGHREEGIREADEGVEGGQNLSGSLEKPVTVGQRAGEAVGTGPAGGESETDHQDVQQMRAELQQRLRDVNRLRQYLRNYVVHFEQSTPRLADTNENTKRTRGRESSHSSSEQAQESPQGEETDLKERAEQLSRREKEVEQKEAHLSKQDEHIRQDTERLKEAKSQLKDLRQHVSHMQREVKQLWERLGRWEQECARRERVLKQEKQRLLDYAHTLVGQREQIKRILAWQRERRKGLKQLHTWVEKEKDLIERKQRTLSEEKRLLEQQRRQVAADRRNLEEREAVFERLKKQSISPKS